MSREVVEIIRCPAELRAEALSIVLSDLAPSQRREVTRGLLDTEAPQGLADEPLFIARRGKQICGAAWGQRQAGNYAVFWPPRVVSSQDSRLALPLAEAVVRELDSTSVELAQSLLADPGTATIDVLQRVGFRHLAELLYMRCEAARFPAVQPSSSVLKFKPYATTQRGRLCQLIEQTYEQTLDCTALNGVRTIDDVVHGYQATGQFAAENWFFVQTQGTDIGVLLLARYPQSEDYELMYLGLVPKARGQGWGKQITRFAQWIVRSRKGLRIVVAVDASNRPAVGVYNATGFDTIEKRAVFLRFPASPSRTH